MTRIRRTAFAVRLESKRKELQKLEVKKQKERKWPWILLGIVIGNFVRPVFDTTLQKLTEQVYEAKIQHPVALVLGQTDSKKSPTTCSSIICDYFTDLSKWTRIDYFRISTTSILTLKPPITENLTGWKTYYSPTRVSPSFEVGFSFISKGSEPNTSFIYGDIFELIVGDGAANRISLKTATGYVAPKGYKIKHFPIGNPIKPNTVIKLKVEVLPVKRSNKLNIKPTINYFSLNGSEENVEGPVFEVETSDASERASALVGFGITDWKRTDLVEITPIDFIVRNLIFSEHPLQRD